MITRQYILQSRHLVAADPFCPTVAQFLPALSGRKCAEDLTYEWPDSEELGLRKYKEVHAANSQRVT